MNGSNTAGLPSISAATQQAAAWFARLRADDVTGADKASFESWLRQDLDHRAAYEEFERLWSSTGGYAGEPALAHAVKSLQHPQRPWLWAAAAGLALIVTGVLLAPRLLNSNGVHQTSVGEQSTMTLEDGSRITLNTDTRLRVTYSAQRRLVQLDHGQAYFKVAPDPARPFEVSTRSGRVRALGTEFEVYQQNTQVLVTLVEGKVMVSGTGAGKVLKPGELIALSPGHPAQIRRASIEHTTAWLSGKLIFNDAPLADAVAEANRYSKRQIAFADDRAKTLRISGVFRTGEPDQFVHAIATYFAVQAREGDDGDYWLSLAE